MKIGIIQAREEVLEEARDKLEEEIAPLEIKTAIAEDPIAAIGKAKRLSKKVDVILMFIGFRDDEEEGMKTGFYNGLAQLEANTPVKIYREICGPLEEPDVEELIDKMIEEEF
ncbi:MAG: hypothetical protein ACOCTT_00205 [archaeon]